MSISDHETNALNTFGERETHARQILLSTQPLEVAAAEDNGAKVVSDRLVQALGRCDRDGRPQRGVVVEPVAVDADLLSWLLIPR
jgi:hypothetical protein